MLVGSVCEFCQPAGAVALVASGRETLWITELSSHVTQDLKSKLLLDNVDPNYEVSREMRIVYPVMHDTIAHSL